MKYTVNAVLISLRPWIGTSFAGEIPGWQREHEARRGTVREVEGEYVAVEWDDMPGVKWSGISSIIERA